MNSRSKMGAPTSVALALFVIIMIGYPIIGMAASFVSLNSQQITIPYRIVILLASISLILSLIVRNRAYPVSFAYLIFCAIYTLRLIFDILYSDLLQTDFMISFFLGVGIIPAVALTLGGGRARLDDQAVSGVLLAVSVLLSVGVVYGQRAGLSVYGDQSEGARFGFSALNTISLGQVGAMGVLAGVWLILERRLGFRLYVIVVLSLMLPLYTLITAASRGPLVAMAVSVAWMVLRRINRSVFYFPFIVIFIIWVIPNTYLYERFMSASSVGLDEISNGRLRLQKDAWMLFFDSPILGGASALHLWGPMTYPHNYLIEILMALGLVGIFVFLWLFHLIISRSVFVGEGRSIIFVLFIFWFASAQFSGAIWGNSQLLALMALLSAPRLTISHRLG